MLQTVNMGTAAATQTARNIDVPHIGKIEGRITPPLYGVRVAPPPASGCSAGPVRSRPRKPQLHLSLEQVENFWAALGSAIQQGLTPNWTLDIHFDKGGVIDLQNRALPCLQAFLKSARQWIERVDHGQHQTAIIWVMENRGDGEGHGIHAHVLIHVPPTLTKRFHQLKRRWARKAGLKMNVPQVILPKPLPTVKAAAGKLKYMSKDLDPQHWHIFDVAGRVHLDDRGKPSDQPVYFKKCGVSRNIDVTARETYRQQRQAITA